MSNEKIGLVGFGYWGKIIFKNLKNMGYENITICEKREVDWGEIGEKLPVVKNYKNLMCDKVFIVTPASTHYKVVEHFLRNGVDVFCEKLLVFTEGECDELYNIARKNDCKLFVDWVFIYNPCVEKIKEIIQKEGMPKNIIANRMNYGPPRYDVDSKWDLASHDVSILLYILDQKPKNKFWKTFKRNKFSKTDDSAVGLLFFEETNAQINVSWEYGQKNRDFILEFDNFFVTWNDINKTVTKNKALEQIKSYSPLEKSIENFMNPKYDMKTQIFITKNTTRILEDER